MLVIVDLDDTLCNTWDAGKSALLRLGLHLIRRRKFRMIKYLLFQGYRELEDVETLHRMDLEEIAEEIFRRVYGEVPREELVESLRVVDAVFFSKLRLYPDALPFLENLRGMGARLVLVTDSSSRWQRRKIDYLGIGKFLDGIIISGETGYSKLTPHNFRLALSKFPDDEVYVVGDRDDTDMSGAKAIGAVGILVRRGYFKRKGAKRADYVVRDLNEALEVIKREHELKKRAEA
ncbi:hydrolase [Thermococcus profundus]|uniref:Hydrolase n=1 Tax=Thermococcus profundus TaxID=49899 RepID=A0A2Z2MI45_THEPR|nr:HAD family hydrolase [Thermococcus profundus]ASJ02101.1 hydrolase [Thermococcus profundus]